MRNFGKSLRAIAVATTMTGVLGMGLAVLPAGTAMADDGEAATATFPTAMGYGVGQPTGSDLGPDDPAGGRIVTDPFVVTPAPDLAGDLITSDGDSVETDVADVSTDMVSTAVNPANCIQQANNPHVSTTPRENGQVKGEVRTTCAYRIQHLYQTAQLWEKRWWGWDRVGTKGVYDKDFPTTTVQTFGRSSCRNNKMRTTGYGEAKIAGKIYYAQTESDAVKIVCPSSATVYIQTAGI